jgi:DNA-binding PadR family transcriptional regulator
VSLNSSRNLHHRRREERTKPGCFCCCVISREDRVGWCTVTVEKILRDENDLPTLILAVLNDGPRHGYAIARSIGARSEGMLTAREGTLYPALRQLESEEFIESLWEHPVSGPARKVYHLTETGQAECARRVAAWQKYAAAFGAIVGGKINEQPT